MAIYFAMVIVNGAMTNVFFGVSFYWGHTLSTFLTIFDQLSNLVSMFTKQALFTKLAFWPIFLTN